uniref:Uncharacterized protein n=1 Tax=Oryza sativa subsp. japonica TaxID=39947 RepID=Q67W62_ORYSJ|nr:hypothetical protein [Oryza sativa Japonica Group]
MDCPSSPLPSSASTFPRIAAVSRPIRRPLLLSSRLATVAAHVALTDPAHVQSAGQPSSLSLSRACGLST